MVFTIPSYIFAEENETAHIQVAMNNKTVENNSIKINDKETIVLSNINGAKMRIAQLERAIDIQIKSGEIILEKIENNNNSREFNLTNLENILAEFTGLKLQIEEFDFENKTTDELAEEFVAIKDQSIELTQKFRNELGNKLTLEEKKELKNKIKEKANEIKKANNEKILKFKNQLNMERLKQLAQNNGIEFTSIKKFENNEISFKELMKDIHAKFKTLSKEKRNKFVQKAKEDRTKELIKAKEKRAELIKNSNEKRKQIKEMIKNNRENIKKIIKQNRKQIREVVSENREQIKEMAMENKEDLLKLAKENPKRFKQVFKNLDKRTQNQLKKIMQERKNSLIPRANQTYEPRINTTLNINETIELNNTTDNQIKESENNKIMLDLCNNPRDKYNTINNFKVSKVNDNFEIFSNEGIRGPTIIFYDSEGKFLVDCSGIGVPTDARCSNYIREKSINCNN